MSSIEYGNLALSAHELSSNSSALLKDQEQLIELSTQYGIPQKDIFLIALNASGIKCGHIENDRGRFIITFPDGSGYFLALTLTSHPFSDFEYHQGKILFNQEVVAKASEIEKDTCTDSYWRRGKKHLTLNSNSRSNCKGCSFCGTYKLSGNDTALTTKTALTRRLQTLQRELGHNLSTVESVGIVTGCFPSENKLFDHLMLVREVLSHYGFTGEIQYLGSQLRSEDKIKQLITTGPFALYLTVEAFQRRKQLMKKTKASLNLDAGRQVLATAKNLGAETSFLYIAGLDSHQVMRQQFPQYKDLITRLPQVQTFQAYNPGQISLRYPTANQIEYFLETRKIVEETFPNLRPIVGNNYRSLWFSSYGPYQLPKPEI